MSQASKGYYEGISEIFKRVFVGKEKLIAAVDALLNAESSVINYRYVQSEGAEEDISIAKDELDANMNALNEALTALDAEELALYNSYFEEIVTYYQDAYTAI